MAKTEYAGRDSLMVIVVHVNVEADSIDVKVDVLQTCLLLAGNEAIADHLCRELVMEDFTTQHVLSVESSVFYLVLPLVI